MIVGNPNTYFDTIEYNLNDFTVETIEHWLNSSFDDGLTDNDLGRHKMAEQLFHVVRRLHHS